MTNKQKAFEVVSKQTGADIELIQEEAIFHETSYEAFFELFDDLSYQEALNLLKMAVSIEFNGRTDGDVAKAMIENHDNIYITEYGYVYLSEHNFI